MPVTTTTSLATLRPDLAGSFQEFDIDAARKKFAALQVLPVFDAPKKSGYFGRVSLESMAKPGGDVDRNPGADYDRGSLEFDDDSYDTQEKGAEETVDDAQSEMYKDYFDMELMATRRALWRIHLKYELEVANALMTTTLFGAGQNAAATGYLSNKSASRFVADVLAAGEKVYNLSGFRPNAMLITEKQYKYLIRTDEITDMIEASGAGQSALPRQQTIEKLKEVFDLDHIFVAGGSYDSAAKGQTRSLTEVWDKTKALVFKVAETNDIQEPCLGRSFHWAEDGSLPQGVIETYRDERVRGDVVRARRQLGKKILYSKLGYLITSVLQSTD